MEVLMDGQQTENKGNINVEGNVNGQFAIGNQITQTQFVQNNNAHITQADLQELHILIEDLKQKVTSTASPEIKDKAIERASELEEAITAQKPDLTTMEYVRNWFVKYLPPLAGTISALVVHPIVGKIVEVSGETIALEFKRRFGIP